MKTQNNKNNIQYLADAILTPQIITFNEFKCKMRSSVLDEATAFIFEEELYNYSLDLESIPLEDYVDEADPQAILLAEFDYFFQTECLVEECFKSFANAEDIEKFIKSFGAIMQMKAFDDMQNNKREMMSIATHQNPIDSKF